MFKEVNYFIRSLFETKDFIPLHEPKFLGNEKKYLAECIDSTFVSSSGKYIDKFEKLIAKKVGSKYSIATVNGTSALHISLILAGVTPKSEVLTQPLTFVATCNAINYINAKPVFIDVSRETMGMCPKSLKSFLNANVSVVKGKATNKTSGKTISACVPMHTFGFPCEIDSIIDICKDYNIAVIEDSAESLGSYYKNKHTGTFSNLGVFSFNGNKIITSGGGGCIVTNDKNLAVRAKHITTTAKVKHRWDYVHDEIGFNYRMPNINAALACAQMENLDKFLEKKRQLSNVYESFFENIKGIKFIKENKYSKANFWLMTILLEDKSKRDKFLQESNDEEIMTRPAWKLQNKLDMFKKCQTTDLTNSKWLADRIVNIPSSVRV